MYTACGVKVYAATTNAGKLAELRALFDGTAFAIDVWERYEAPEETAPNYAGNAEIKARALFEQMRAADVPAAVLADDSGLELAALDGRPGIRSARYGGEAATWDDRRRGLLAEVAASASSDRGARFVCAMCLIDPSGAVSSVVGTVDGELAREPAGEAGFSYDAIFWYPPLDRTFAQIDPATKNRISHRGIAVRRLIAALSDNGCEAAATRRENEAPSGT